MNLFLIFLAIAGIFCDEMLVTREYTDYLKKHVSWEVVDYEDNVFRGWTVEEAKSLLIQDIPDYDESLPLVVAETGLPSELNWGGGCIHEVRDQSGCGAGWALATVGMLSDRCCIHSSRDHGWLSVQELISCDVEKNRGCQGGWPQWAIEYIVKAKGLVHEACFPYVGKSVPCPYKCQDGKDWVKSHICGCGGPKQCLGVENMKTCLKGGPITAAFEVTNSFFSYKSGIFKCDGRTIGLYAGRVTGYSDENICHWIVMNSWGRGWGMNGYFKIACTTCGIHGIYGRGNVACEKVGDH